MDTVKFQLGQKVYKRLDSEQAGFVTGIMFRPGSVSYLVTFSNSEEVTLYDFELNDTKSYESAQG